MMYNKLVRDNILEIIDKAGKKYAHHNAYGVEYEEKLKEKLLEEVGEFYDNPCELEMADILEVLNSLMELYIIDPYEVETARLAKLHSRGGFSKKIILEEVKD